MNKFIFLLVLLTGVVFYEDPFLALPQKGTMLTHPGLELSAYQAVMQIAVFEDPAGTDERVGHGRVHPALPVVQGEKTIALPVVCSLPDDTDTFCGFNTPLRI